MAKKNTRSQTSSLLFWIVFIVVVVIGIIVGMSLKGDTHTFNCDDGKTVKVKFYNSNNPSADVTLGVEKNVNLPETPSAGGARYANSDESIVLWNTGNIVTVEQNGQTTYVNCVEK